MLRACASVPACSRAVARGAAPYARALATKRVPLIRFLGKRSKLLPSAAPTPAPASAPASGAGGAARAAPFAELSWDDPALADALYGRPRLSDDELEAVNSGGASLVSFRVKEMHALVP